MLNLRAEKTTKNRDDFRVLLAGSVICILFMLISPLVQRYWDTYISERPFITASIEIIKVDGRAEPMILYDADARREINALWIAAIYDEHGTRLSSRRGEGSYTVTVDEPKYWTWAGFFDNETGVNPPAIPEVPFVICVRYVATTVTGVRDDIQNTCSNVFTPNSS